MNVLSKNMVLFSLLVLGNGALANRALSPIVDFGIATKYQEIMQPRVNADLIVLGDSTSEMGVLADRIDLPPLRSFNFSETGAKPSFFYNWYRKLFRFNYPKPKLVLYCAHWTMLMAGARRFEQDSAFFPTHLYLNELRSGGTSKLDLILNRFAILKCKNKNLGELLMFYILSQRKNSLHGLAQPVPDSANDQIPSVQSTRNSAIPMDPDEEIKFNQLLDQIQSDGIPVILVNMPDYTHPLADQEISGRRQFTETLTAIAKNKKIVLLDYNPAPLKSLNDSRNLYFDSTHLNDQGADLFTELLSVDLRKTLDPAHKTSTQNYLILADIYKKLGQYQFAQESFQKAINLNPRDASALSALGEFQILKLNQPSSAKISFEKALLLTPDDPRLLNNLGNIYFTTRRFAQAQQLYLHALKIDPQNSTVSENLRNVEKIMGTR